MNRLPLFLVALVTVGCGGRETLSSPRLIVRFVWPKEDARVVPASSQSIRIELGQSGAVIGDMVIARPTTTATFADLPPGTVTVAASARPNADGTGASMASATTSTTISAGSTQSIDLTMASTVDRLVVAPSPVNLALLGLLSQALTVTAYDGNNAVILTSPTDYAYTTSNGLLFDVDANGVVRGLTITGLGTVTATHRDSGKSATASVRITVS